MLIDANDLTGDRKALSGRRDMATEPNTSGVTKPVPYTKLILASPPYSGTHGLFHRRRFIRFESVHVAGSPEGAHLDHLSLIVEPKGIE